MEKIQTILEELKAAIRESEAYGRYQKARGQVCSYPEKANRLQEYRKKTYTLQNSEEPVDLFAELDRLEQEYTDVYKDPVLMEYLASEVALCRMVQHISREIIESLDFEVVLFEDSWMQK